MNGPPEHTLTGVALGGSRVKERSRLSTNWRSTVNKDLLRMGITGDEAEPAEVAALDRSESR